MYSFSMLDPQAPQAVHLLFSHLDAMLFPAILAMEYIKKNTILNRNRNVTLTNRTTLYASTLVRFVMPEVINCVIDANVITRPAKIPSIVIDCEWKPSTSLFNSSTIALVFSKSLPASVKSFLDCSPINSTRSILDILNSVYKSYAKMSSQMTMHLT